MTQFIVDANVAIKWVLPEIHSEAALRLRNTDYALLVPDFFFPEIGNILWKRVRRGETTLENAQEDLDALMGLSLQIQQKYWCQSSGVRSKTAFISGNESHVFCTSLTCKLL